MANFCTNCGSKIEKDYKFCINCGAKIGKSDRKENKPLLKTVNNTINEKKKSEKSSQKQKKPQVKKEIRHKPIVKNEPVRGGYCSMNCRHCYEELFDSGGGIVGDLEDDGYTEYYCHLGHSISLGRFCEDYE